MLPQARICSANPSNSRFNQLAPHPLSASARERFGAQVRRAQPSAEPPSLLLTGLSALLLATTAGAIVTISVVCLDQALARRPEKAKPATVTAAFPTRTPLDISATPPP